MNTKNLFLTLIVGLLTLSIVSGVGLAGLAGMTDDTKVTVTASGEGLWIFPGPRNLDPEVFGTPDQPKMVEALPLEERKVSEDGESFTMTKSPGPFSNKVAPSEGELSLTIWDRTELDSMNSRDEAELEATFEDPSGKNTYRVVLQKLIPVGPHHQFFGGAATNVYMHGSTGVGEPLMPATWSYVTLWGFGDFYRNGEKLDDRRLIHVMLTPRMRTEDNELGFDVAKMDELEIHFIMPPTRVEKGHPVTKPVPTKLELPNGKDQPFIHFNFYGNIRVEENKYLN